MPLRSPLRSAENVRELDDAGVDRTTTEAVMDPGERKVPRFEMIGRRSIRTRSDSRRSHTSRGHFRRSGYRRS